MDIDTKKPRDTLISMAYLFDSCNAERLGDFTHHSFLAKALNDENFSEYELEEINDYRERAKRQFPKLYRIKLSVEIEEVDDSESEKYWTTGKL